MSRSRAWCFELFTKNEESLKNIFKLDCQYGIYGKKVEEDGEAHILGYVYFKNARMFKSLKKKVPGAHWCIRNGSHCETRDNIKEFGEVLEFGLEPKK